MEQLITFGYVNINSTAGTGGSSRRHNKLMPQVAALLTAYLSLGTRIGDVKRLELPKLISKSGRRGRKALQRSPSKADASVGFKKAGGGGKGNCGASWRGRWGRSDLFG